MTNLLEYFNKRKKCVQMDKIEWKSFDKFQKNMINVLIEKAEKYKEKWKFIGYNDLFFKLTKIVNNMINITNITNIEPINHRETQRKLIHIANYAYFLYIRLENILKFST